MPIASLLMVAHNTISNLNNSENEFSKELRPLDFTMSKFKSSSTGAAKHPLSQYFDAHQSSSTNRDAGSKEEQGKCKVVFFICFLSKSKPDVIASDRLTSLQINIQNSNSG